MTARTPWSGAYSIDPPIYSAAHTAQFAPVGSWLFNVGSGSGYLKQGGSYVSYVSKDSEFTLVIEKVSPHEAGCGFSAQGSYNVTDEVASFTFALGTTLRARLAETKLAGFRSNFARSVFLQPIRTGMKVDSDGTFSLSVDDLITLTNTRIVGSEMPVVSPAPTIRCQLVLLIISPVIQSAPKLLSLHRHLALLRSRRWQMATRC